MIALTGQGWRQVMTLIFLTSAFHKEGTSQEDYGSAHLAILLSVALFTTLGLKLKKLDPIRRQRN